MQDNFATISVTRAPGGTRDRMRAYTVVIDGVSSGAIKAGESINIPVAPGQHAVQLKIDWCTSPTITVQVVAAESVTLLCSPGGSAFMALWDMLRPGAYITLVRTD